MKAYLSYWSGGWQKKPSDFVIDMHRVSTFLAKKHFGEVHFLCDSASKNYFKGIDFDSTEIILDDLNMEYRDVWSVSKLIAYKHLCEVGDPFIHIDYDVFLWEGIPERLKNARVFAQCEEHNSYYWYEVEKYLEHCKNAYLIREIDPKPLHGINVGIFGGNDLDFIKKYSQSALDMIFDKENYDFFTGENVFKDHWNRAVITEQYNLATACAYYGVKPELYFENGWPGNEEANEKKYTHLMGAKSVPGLSEKISLLASTLKTIEEKKAKELDANSKKIIKFFGLPRTGTNLLEKSLILNVKNYVCQHSDYHSGYHYLGWKHGLPQSMSTYDDLQKKIGEKIYFVFLIRNFESWKNSIVKNHTDSWEFPLQYKQDDDFFAYNTPHGPEFYKNLKHLYETYNGKYKKFAEEHEDRCILIDFENLTKDQKGTIEKIVKKFELDFSHESFYEIKKQIDTGGRITDFMAIHENTL